jgi:hypothetical protein
VVNSHPLPFSGWVRLVTDQDVGDKPVVNNFATVVPGRKLGLNARIVDVRIDVGPEQRVVVPLTGSPATSWQLGGVDVAAIGWPQVGGQDMILETAQADGAGWLARFHLRVGPMLHVRMWALYRPDEPGMARGEVMVTASSPNVPDLVADTGEGLRVTWGSAHVGVVGLGWGQNVVDSTTMASGQAVVKPVVFLWPQLKKRFEEEVAAWQWLSSSIGGHAITQLTAGGNPEYVQGFEPSTWTYRNLPEALRRLNTWEPALLGPAAITGTTGSQDDQVFVRGEPILPLGDGAEQLVYLCALKRANLPLHHLDWDGRQVGLERHPNLKLWDGQPHWDRNVSPDQLGKPRRPTVEETHFWYGPDAEHDFCNTLVAAARYTGSPAPQYLMAAEARCYMFQKTLTPGWSTTQPYASRAVGWECLNLVHWWRDLEDRQLAKEVLDHGIARITRVIVPAFRNKDVWDARLNDARLGQGLWWMPWQQSVGAYFLGEFARANNLDEARAVALQAAKKVMADAWVKVGERWESRAVMPLEGGGNSDGSFNLYGMSLAPYAVLAEEPNDAKSLSVASQLEEEAKTRGYSWMPPQRRKS